MAVVNITSDLTSSTSERKRINCNLLDPREETKSLETQPFHYFSRNQIVAAQLAEVEAHTYNVEHGTCWRELYSSHPPLEPSVIAYGDLPPETSKLLTWTGSEKAIFIELIGRRSASALPEIAAKLGKSYFECQTYLNMLQEASVSFTVDFADIPAADEVPENFMEPDLDGPPPKKRKKTLTGLEENSGSCSESDTERSIFVHKRLASILGKSRTSFSDKPLQMILRQKLSEWIEACFTRMLNKTSLIVTDEIVDQVVSINDGLLDCDSFFVKAVTGNDDMTENVSDETDETEVDQLMLEETYWLEQLDAFNSAITLHMRGLISHSEVGNPPDVRRLDLQKFMQSR